MSLSEHGGNLLCIGHGSHDLAPMLPVAERAREELGLNPLLVVNARGQGEFGKKSEEWARSTGFRIYDKLTWTADAGGRNIIRRLRAIRQKNLGLTHDILADTRPAAILATHDIARELFLDEATRVGVPTINLQVSFWQERSLIKQLRKLDETAGTDARRLPKNIKAGIKSWLEARAGLDWWRPAWERYTTKVAVLGPRWETMLTQEKFDPSRIEITGSPTCDWLHKARIKPPEQRLHVYEALKLQPGTQYFLHCREHYERVGYIPAELKNRGQIEIIQSLRAADPARPIVVKLHPKEGDAEEAFIRSVDANAIVVRDEIPLMDLIMESCVTISTASTTLIWSAALDRPTVSAYFWPKVDFVLKSSNWSGVERLFEPREFTEAIRRHLSDPAHIDFWNARRRSFVNDTLLVDGQSTGRLTRMIERLVSERNSKRLTGGFTTRRGES